MHMRIKIDRSKCVGGGNCVLSAPTVFTQDNEDGLVVVLDENPPADQGEAVQLAIELCPAKVIWLDAEDPATGRR
jgi:ferredoxin